MQLAKKILVPLAGLAIAIGVAMTAITPALADDEIQPYTSIDQDYAFSFEHYGNSRSTPGAAKENATSAYVWAYINTVNGGCLITIDGYSASTGWTNKTVGVVAELRQGDTNRYRVRNMVYEDGMRLARMSSSARGSGQLIGQWSPDSTVANPWLN